MKTFATIIFLLSFSLSGHSQKTGFLNIDNVRKAMRTKESIDEVLDAYHLKVKTGTVNSSSINIKAVENDLLKTIDIKIKQAIAQVAFEQQLDLIIDAALLPSCDKKFCVEKLVRLALNLPPIHS